MSGKDDWKEIEEWQMSKEIEDIDKYGNVPTDKESKKIVGRLNKIMKIFQSKILKLLLIVFFILYCVLATIRTNEESDRIFNLRILYTTITLKENSYKYNLLGDGYYTYNIKEEPDILAHSFTNRRKEIFFFDMEDRVVKSYYDKWVDNYKENFKVNEKYEDCTYLWHREKNWIYSFEAYVNVSSYNEMIQATEAIIRFKNFMSHFDICEKFYIYYKNRRIYPSNFSFESSEVVRKSAIDQFNSIEKEEQD